ncbi:MAG: glycosyltransferase [Candidatus Eisenbacteria bacterium]
MTHVAIGLGGPSLLDEYRSLLGDGPIRTLEGLARDLGGRRLVMVNSTASGGGVAEILHRLVRLLLELGVPTTWEVMPGDARFYGITKTLHNRLHGLAATLTPEDVDYFHEHSRRAARELDLDGDLILIHDPQPVSLVLHRRRRGQTWVWRCHIDLSRAGADAWEILAAPVAAHDAAVFSHVDFVPALTLPTYVVPPSIDPFSDKNRPLSVTEADAALTPFGLPARRAWVTQVSRFDRLKDPLGVLEAFTLLRRRVEAHLVLAGGSADDDPEGAVVLDEVRARAQTRSDVSILSLPPDAHVVINALQRRSTVVVQKSLREGFALTVAEALWKRRAVVGSAIGGIPLQIVHERTGLLARSIEGCAHQVERALRAPALRRRLGDAGHDHVRHHFLHPREARDYLAVFARLAQSWAA